MENELGKRYNPADVEEKWYTHWKEQGRFRSVPDDRPSFSIVIPPPNVTGVLHMGHMLNNTIQDVLVRKARMEGKNACWVPGTDHASIATEAKVVRMLREKGIRKSDLTRERFLEYAWEWKEKYGGIILKQLQKLGASCDWERTAFTMDAPRSKAVIRAFIDLYNKGVLYRGLRMVNWDPEAQTVLSNEEVIYHDEQSTLYHLRYRIEGTTDEFVTIATTRPETILGDTAIAVHPDDERYQHLRGKRAVIPLLKRSVPIIFDDYVDREFGTGALKVTPAHDVNDYEIGKRHDLEVIDILNGDGTLNADAKMFVGMDRFEVRTAIEAELQAAGHLVKTEIYGHSVGRSERTNAVIEPKLSLQWYVRMSDLAKPALEAVLRDDVVFFPKNQQNIYRHWMENIRDWCISRQLWWGHRIPAYYWGDHVFVAETAEEALEQAREKLPGEAIELTDLKQDEDVLDTWFSSWLWPISVFDEGELDYYYPTSVLVTGWDIIFLWVARMIMAGYQWKNERPFAHVYFTGMVRDKQRRKMSKQLGNSPDALKLIETFGADGVRFGMLSCSPAGGDLLFDEKLCEQGRNFCNKMWNALRLVKGWQVSATVEQPATLTLVSDWFSSKWQHTLKELDKSFSTYRLSEGLIALYSFVWNDFFSWYLEVVKPPFGTPIDGQSYRETIRFFEELMRALHPFMPFITEELWHQLAERETGVDCIIQPYPQGEGANETAIEQVECARNIVAKIRDLRNKNSIKMREPLRLYAEKSTTVQRLFQQPGWVGLIAKMAHISHFEITDTDVEGGVAFMSDNEKYFLEINQQVDMSSERQRLEKELERARAFVASVRKKLDNDRFVQNAPEQVVDRERKKLSDGLERIRIIEESLQRLN